MIVFYCQGPKSHDFVDFEGEKNKGMQEEELVSFATEVRFEA